MRVLFVCKLFTTSRSSLITSTARRSEFLLPGEEEKIEIVESDLIID